MFAVGSVIFDFSENRNRSRICIIDNNDDTHFHNINMYCSVMDFYMSYIEGCIHIFKTTVLQCKINQLKILILCSITLV